MSASEKTNFLSSRAAKAGLISLAALGTGYLFYRVVRKWKQSKEQVVKVVYNESQVPAEDDLKQSATQIARNLNRVILSLMGKYFDDQGKVNYKALAQSPDYVLYQKATGALKQVDLGALSRAELIAFCLNIYNALVIHASIERGPPSTPEARKTFFVASCYNIGGLIYSLDELEHGLLRCNAIHPTTKRRYFDETDPRARYALKELDPRIHFALVCGATSCPPIRIFTTDNLERGLDKAATSFCNREIDIDLEKKEISASRILMWYGGDFGSDETAVLRCVLPFLRSPKQEELRSLLEGKNFTVKYKDYDWSVNGTI